MKPNEVYLEPTFFLDYNSTIVSAFATKACANAHTPVEKAIALFYAVRDQITYTPYELRYSRNAMQASTIVQQKTGYCVSKAVLLAAVARHQTIPARLGFADVTNHLSTPRLRAMMGTDLFIYHGYTELYLNKKWLKATPAFNLSLCTRFDVKPLEFDGRHDAIFHEYDVRGRRHMEYIRDRGHYADLPFEEMFAAYAQAYPNFFENSSDNTSSYDFSPEANPAPIKE